MKIIITKIQTAINNQIFKQIFISSKTQLIKSIKVLIKTYKGNNRMFKWMCRTQITTEIIHLIANQI